MSAHSLPRLGVNIDHIATLRQLRGTPYPDIVEAAHLVEKAGAHQITVHLREDRRHIQDDDVRALRGILNIPLNLEMAVSPEIIRFAKKIHPDWVCLVPEKRREVTTEGGLDVARNKKAIAAAVSTLKKSGIQVSLFIEPTAQAVQLSQEVGADAVELHTGRYCIATQSGSSTHQKAKAAAELDRIRKASTTGVGLGIHVHAGHGLDYVNVRPVVELEYEGRPLIEEYNIGHSIVCRAAIVGLERATREMLSAITAP